jgi:hypothetical protein
VNSYVQQGKEWMQKPAQQQLGDVVEAVGEQGVTAPLSAVALGGAGKVVAGAAGEVAAEVAGKAGKAAAQVADHAPPLVKVAKKPKRKGPPKAASPAQAVSAGTTRGGPGPVRQGQAGVAQAEKELKAQGYTVETREATFDTPAGRRRADLIVRSPKGKQVAIEVKTGGSSYTPMQQAKDRALEIHGGVPAGARAAEAGLSGPAPVKIPTTVIRIR